MSTAGIVVPRDGFSEVVGELVPKSWKWDAIQTPAGIL
jgi:hypothetical protein